MNEGLEGVQQEQLIEVDGVVMSEELADILEMPKEHRIPALEAFVETYERKKLNEMCEGILWKAELFLKTDRASVEVSQLAG